MTSALSAYLLMVNAVAQISPYDVRFVEAAHAGNSAEIRLGALAARKGASPEIRAFGRMMVEDHGKSQAELALIVKKRKVHIPGVLSHRAQELYDRLAKLSGRNFDRAYRQAMIADHQADISAYNTESKRGEDPEIRGYATRTLPKLKMHLEAIRATQY